MKLKYTILICVILLIVLSFVGFKIANNYLRKLIYSKNNYGEKPITVSNARGVYVDDVNNAENSDKIKDIYKYDKDIFTENINPDIKWLI